MKPRITLIVPVYNKEKYLSSCLDCALGHSFDNIEVIAVDDASTDNSAAMLAERAAADSRLKVITQTQNGGTLIARLAGLRAAQGDYIAFMDQDDRISIPVVEKALETAEKTQADIVQFGAEIVQEDTSGKCRVFEVWKPGRKTLHGIDILHRMSVYENHFWIPWDKIYRKEILQRAADRIIPDRFILGEDLYLVYLASYFARKYVPLRETGYWHCRDTGESSLHPISIANFRSNQCPTLRALERIRDFLIEENVFEAVKKEFIRNEGEHLEYLILLWRKAIPPETRAEGLEILFHYRDSAAMLRAFQRSFGSIGKILELLDESPVVRREKETGICIEPNPDELPPFSWKNTARWDALLQQIRVKSAGTVILSAKTDNDALFQDVIAAGSAGCRITVCWQENFIDAIRENLPLALKKNRICEFADRVIVPPGSQQWFSVPAAEAISGAEAVRDSVSIRQPLLAALRLAVRKEQQYVIEPSADGETFVPFFRKLNRLFLALPPGFRKPVFGFLGRLYNRLRGQ